MDQVLSILTFILRIFFPIVAIGVIATCVISLFRNRPRVHKMAQLVNTETGEVIEINHWETSIGKSKSNDIVLNSPSVSRFHAVISKKQKDWVVTDTFSKNGIKVNGNIVPGKSNIENLDLIEIGSNQFEFQCADAISSSTKKEIKKEASRTNTNPHSVAYAVLVDVKSRKPIYLKKHDVLIGSGDNCDIQILSSNLSEEHARIHQTTHGWALSDLNSISGTKLNGRYIDEPQLIFDEDMITFGDRVMIFYEK